jgi:pyruvate/2-oxoglutarate dehydrogenase complex dihydrolipoamide dehydrogenase (E3) component
MRPWLPDEPAVQPFDPYNQELLSQVHPADWENPTPAPRYDLVVIGAGTAGLVVAAGAAGLNLGLKIALIEKSLIGGDCLTLGCVPSKTLLKSARVAATLRNAASVGIRLPDLSPEIDFAAVMERVRRVRAEISHHDAAAEFQSQGIDIFFGQAAFADAQTIIVERTGQGRGERLRFKKAVIATGARATAPNIAGLAEVGYLTHETVFSLTQRPQRLAVIGGGPIGCELAQAFQRLGTQVTLFHRQAHLLNREEVEAAQVLEQQFESEGLHLRLGSTVSRVSPAADRHFGAKVIEYQYQGQTQTVTVDEILVGTGRAPRLDGLNLAVAGVESNAAGVRVNDYLQTTNPRIYAAGDVCLDWKFTHAADAAARIVIRNALFAPLGLGRSRLSQLVMPWATYTDPEIAHVGLYPAAAQRRGLATETVHVPLTEVDRAITDSATEGFVRVLLRRGSDRILGATIVAPHAGDLISEITLAMVTKQGLGALAQTIHPYPTLAEAIKRVADQYYRRTFLSAPMQLLLKLAATLS